MRGARLGLMVVLALGTVACGSGTDSSSSGDASSDGSTSPPIVRVSAPRYTGYHMPSSSMEPTLHCAKPGFGCGASQPDRLLVQSFDSAAPRRGDIVVF